MTTLSETPRSVSTVEQVLCNSGLLSVILCHITDPFDLDSISRTTRLWSTITSETIQRIRCRQTAMLPSITRRFCNIASLCLDPCTECISTNHMELLVEKFGSLRELSMQPCSAEGCRVSYRVFEAVGRLTALESLQLKGLDRVSERGLLVLAKQCQTLRHLSLGNVGNHSRDIADDQDEESNQSLVLSEGPSISREGFSTLIRGNPHLKSLELVQCRFLDNSCLAVILACPSLTSLTLLGELKFTSTGFLGAFYGCTKLKKLDISIMWQDSWINVDPLLDSVARRCKHLEELRVLEGFSRLGLLSLRQCSSLVSLTLRSEINTINADLAQILATNSKLTSLDVSETPQKYALVGDPAVLAVASKATGIKCLKLRSDEITDFALESLAYCSEITSLHLSSSRITDKGLIALAGTCQNLEDLSLSWSSSIGDAGLQMLTAGCIKLQQVDLSHCRSLTSVGLAALASCSLLEKLDISYTTVDDSSLVAVLRTASCLQELRLERCQHLTGIGGLAMCRSLLNLHLSGCPAVSDDGLAALSGACTRLRKLGLAATRISDKGIEALTNCTQLQWLDLAFCPDIQGPGLLSLAQAARWLRFVTVSSRLEEEEALAVLKGRGCSLTLRMERVPNG